MTSWLPSSASVYKLRPKPNLNDANYRLRRIDRLDLGHSRVALWFAIEARARPLRARRIKVRAKDETEADKLLRSEIRVVNIGLRESAIRNNFENQIDLCDGYYYRFHIGRRPFA